MTVHITLYYVYIYIYSMYIYIFYVYIYYIYIIYIILYCIILYYKYNYSYINIYTPDISCYMCAPIIQPMFFWVVHPPVMKTRHLHPRALALDWKPLHLGQFCCQTSPNCWAVLEYSHIYIYMYIIYRSTVQNHCWWSTIWDYTRQYIEDYQHPLWESLLTRHYRGTTEGLTMLICSTIVNHQLKPPVNQWFNCSHQQIKKQIT